ncbi:MULTISPECIES: zinc-dependent dehydrogenase [unclassified Microbacterium]|uniref:zinc-dependent dehydrogenase n=1 Tax=unclassified Microbacterium TaxID=2609290 RepID=UPI001AC6CA09|nr:MULTISPECIES: zinc-dependent dehydrogenase [unclassified Microbacterium]MBN9158426.1 zinc-dependent dehydrogenase [Microbacterium sp.]
MKAAVFRAPGVIEIDDIPVPEIGADEVLLRVRAASICGTDLRIMKHGHFRLPAGQNRVLGHEIAGEIVSAGEQVVGYGVGDRVCVVPNVGCGRCKLCRRGLNNLCPDYEAFGITMDGGFEEFMRVPAAAIERGNLVHIPDALSFEEAAILEPMSCCLHGQRKVDVQADDVVVIVGAGPIGCFHALLAKQQGVETVIVANTRQPRLEIARRMGADITINVSEQDLRDEVLRITGGEGADVVITCVSKPEVIAGATDLIGRLGRINVFSGLGDQARPPIDVNALHYREQVLTGTTGSSVRDYTDVVAMAASPEVDLSPVITDRFAVEDIHAAMAQSASGNGMKSVVLFD